VDTSDDIVSKEGRANTKGSPLKAQPISPVVTINLTGFNLAHPDHDGCSRTALHRVTVGVSVSKLDESGFVSEVEEFIHTAQRRTYQTGAEIVTAMRRQAESFVGNRLLGVSTEVIPFDRTSPPVKDTWTATNHPVIERVESPYLMRMSEPRSMNVLLVANAVCGGYQGSFDYRMSLTTKRETSPREFIYAAAETFGHETRKASCEELALGLIHVANRLYGKSLVTATPQVFNLTGHVEAHWQSGWTVPPFPRIATRREKEETVERRRNPDRYAVSKC